MPVRPTNALVVGALVALACCGVGCDSQPWYDIPRDGNHIPVQTPLNGTPRNTMLRLEAAYQYQDLSVYKSLLTADFRYTFSPQSDSALVALYGDNWGKVDEVLAAQRLLTGFTNAQGKFMPPASSVILQFANDQYLADPAHADSAANYDDTPIGAVALDVDIPTSTGTITYGVRAPHRFFLVRGDAAVLDPGQPADSLHWYVRRWDDLAAPPGGATTAASVATTWGRLKARYR